MFRLRQFPSEFKKWIPPKPPHSSFFVHVQEFFDQQRLWKFHKQDNVDLFEKFLTKAIHEDMGEAKAKFSDFRYKLEPMEKAFESLVKAYSFLDDFDHFADRCLRKHYRWNEFHDYVREVLMRATYFQKMKSVSYSVTERPLPWPSLDDEIIAISMEDINTNRRIGIHTGPRAKPERMAARAIENFQLAISIYNKLHDEYLVPQFQKLMSWLRRTVCWLHIKQEFQREHYRLVEGVLNEKTKLLREKEKLDEYRSTGAGIDVKESADMSMEAAQQAVIAYQLAMSVHHKIMVGLVLQAYQHALDVLENFSPLVTTQNWTGSNEAAEKERNKAGKSVFKWKKELEHFQIRKLLQATTLSTVLKNLPELYNCIAQFTFKYHSAY